MATFLVFVVAKSDAFYFYLLPVLEHLVHIFGLIDFDYIFHFSVSKRLKLLLCIIYPFRHLNRTEGLICASVALIRASSQYPVLTTRLPRMRLLVHPCKGGSGSSSVSPPYQGIGRSIRGPYPAGSDVAPAGIVPRC